MKVTQLFSSVAWSLLLSLSVFHCTSSDDTNQGTAGSTDGTAGVAADSSGTDPSVSTAVTSGAEAELDMSKSTTMGVETVSRETSDDMGDTPGEDDSETTDTSQTSDADPAGSDNPSGLGADQQEDPATGNASGTSGTEDAVETDDVSEDELSGAGGSAAEEVDEVGTGGAPAEPRADAGAPEVGVRAPHQGLIDDAFWLGADISIVQEEIDSGATYVDTDGQQKDMLSLLANHGFNAIRLRVFVDPGARYGYASSDGCPGKSESYCDKNHTVEFAQQIKAAGMKLLLDFHYSDTWADPNKQVVPQAWRGETTIEGLADQVRNHTVDVMTALADVDAMPDMVQVGNEITPGMLIHEPTGSTDCWGNNGNVRMPNGSTSNWSNLAALLKAGIEGVHMVGESVPIMLHIESTDELQRTRSWVQGALDNGVEFDVLGLSCYTEWQGPPSTWENTFNALAEEFPSLVFVMAEYNPQRREANRIMWDLPDGRGIGTFFWEPTLSGSWGSSMFQSQGGARRANSSDFAEYDQIRTEVGL
jgi:arabinogalactan endo-1,4-beta-galactosidase